MLLRPQALMALLALLRPPGSSAEECVFEAASRGCAILRWDIAGLAAAVPAAGHLQLNDSWPEPYLVAPPCGTVDISSCPACKAVCRGGDGVGSRCGGAAAPVGVQLEPFFTTSGAPDPKRPCSEGSRCFSIGGSHARAAPIDPADPGRGLHLAYPGGDDGRELHHWIHCDPAATKTTAPTTLVTFDNNLPGYNVNWTSALGCPTISKGNCSTAGLPKPTPEQLAWQQGEIMALIHFEMATFYGESGCGAANWPGANGSSNPKSFAPTNLSTDSWAASMQVREPHFLSVFRLKRSFCQHRLGTKIGRALKKESDVFLQALGVKESVLTAKHGCGFCIWPTTAKLPDGR